MDIQRLILFVVFSFSLLMLWENWQKDHMLQTPTVATNATTPATNVNSTPVALNISKQATDTVIKKTDGVLVNGAKIVVTTDLVRAVIDVNGGDIRSLAM